jgi:hypothetical protein
MNKNEFKTIPGFPKYEVNRDGKVRYISTKHPIMLERNSTVRITDSKGKRHRMWPDKLVEMTFRKEKVKKEPEIKESELTTISRELYKQEQLLVEIKNIRSFMEESVRIKNGYIKDLEKAIAILKVKIKSLL